MTWQSIETAPKDGSWVLLFGGKPDCDFDCDAARPPVVAARWIPTEIRTTYDSPGLWRFCSYDSGYYGEWENPTHWMPLPEPPK